jgi:hypothetical protein
MAVLFTIFTPWPPPPPADTSGTRVGYYIGLLGVLGLGMLFGALCLEFTYRVFRWKGNWVERRRSKESEQMRIKLK